MSSLYIVYFCSDESKLSPIINNRFFLHVYVLPLKGLRGFGWIVYGPGLFNIFQAVCYQNAKIER